MENREKQIYRTTLIGSVVNIILSVMKFIAGIVGHSSAMIADAVHSLSDLISDAIVLFFVKIANKPQDADHPYGHGKYETLATVIIGVILGAVGIGILIDGITKTIGFFHGDTLTVPNWWALGAALLSIVSKEWLFRFTIRVGRKVDSNVLIANAWHHRSDAYTSVATVIGIGGAMLLGPRWAILDPLAAAAVSIFIIIEAWQITHPALDELLEKSLSDDELREISRIIMSVDGVKDFHHLRTRKVGAQTAISMHIKLPGQLSLTDAHAIATEVEDRLRLRYGPRSIITVHMEPYHTHPSNIN